MSGKGDDLAAAAMWKLPPLAMGGGERTPSLVWSGWRGGCLWGIPDLGTRSMGLTPRASLAPVKGRPRRASLPLLLDPPQDDAAPKIQASNTATMFLDVLGVVAGEGSRHHGMEEAPCPPVEQGGAPPPWRGRTREEDFLFFSKSRRSLGASHLNPQPKRLRWGAWSYHIGVAQQLVRWNQLGCLDSGFLYLLKALSS